MKNLKKVLALVLALGMILSTFTALTTVSAEETAEAPAAEEVVEATEATEEVAEEATEEAAEETAEEEATEEVVAISANSIYSFSDTEGTEYAEAAEVLSALNIAKGYEDGTFGGEKTVTRAEMSAFIVREIGLGAIAESAAVNASSFSDVAANHWAVGSINIANEKNIINGLGDGRFAPDKTVEYQAAVKMLVCALGYNVVATRNGGWPQGYLIAGAQIGLTDGITGVAGTDGCSRGVVAQLLYNALEINLMQETVYAGSAVQIEETGEDLLFDKLGVVRMFDATILATPTQTVSGERTNAGFARINGVRHIDVTDDEPNPRAVTRTAEIADTNPDLFFGDSIVAYYKFNGDNKNPTLLCIIEDTVRQETFELDVRDLYSKMPIVEAGELDYNNKPNNSDYARIYYKTADDAKAKYVKVVGTSTNDPEDTLDIVVNGRNDNIANWVDFIDNNGTPADKTDDTITLVNGTIKFIDAKDEDGDPNPDGIYEKAIIDTYVDYVVEEVDVDGEKVIARGGEEITLDETKIFAIVDVEGNELGLADLNENDVLSIYPDDITSGVDQAEVLRIVAASNPVEGVVTEITNKGLYIDDEFYKVNEDATLGIDLDNFELEDEGIFFLNADGHIVFCDTTSAAKDYALIYDAFADNSRKVTVSVLTSAGETIELVASGNVDVVEYATAAGKYSATTTEYSLSKNQINDVAVAGSTAAAELVTKLDVNAGATYAPYIVGYDLKKGSETQIDKIYIAGTGIATVNEKANKLPTRFGIWATSVEERYYTSDSMLADYIVDASTVIFDVPTSVESADDAKDIKVISKSGLKNDTKYHNIEIYEVDKNDYAKAVVIRSERADVDMDSPISIITNISKAKNADGDDVHKIYMLQNGREVVKMTEDDALINNYGTGTAPMYTQESLDVGYAFYPGSVIIYNEASDGAIDELIKIYPVPSKVAATDSAVLPYYLEQGFITWDGSRNSVGKSDNADCFIVFGQVTEKNANNGLITIATFEEDAKGVPTATNKRVAFAGTNVTVVDYNFDEVEERVTKGSASDIKAPTNTTEGSYVLVRKDSGKVMDIVVYKNFEKLDLTADYVF